MSQPAPDDRETAGQYTLHGEIGGGGMATVHFGRVAGAIGFARTVAIKRLHAGHGRDPHFVTMFMDEARLAARVRHPNVVQTLDVVLDRGELFLILEYVHGLSLARLMKRALEQKVAVPLDVACALAAGMLYGLHAAHEATDESGNPLEIVHRDVSPQNVLVGSDGVTRVLDFGVAKAVGKIHNTREGEIKGKLAYMAPEQITGVNVTRRCDVFAASIVSWEILTGRRLFRSETESETVAKVMGAPIEKPSTVRADVAAVDDVVMKGLERDQNSRWASAREMARALEKATRVASTAEVGEWLESVVGDELAELTERVAKVEKEGGRLISADPSPPEVDSRSSVKTRKEASPTAIEETETEEKSLIAAAASTSAPVTNAGWRRAIPAALAVAGVVLGVAVYRIERSRGVEAPVTTSPAAIPSIAAPVSPASAPPATASAAPPSVDVTLLPASPTGEPRRAHKSASHAPSASAAAVASAPATASATSAPPDCNPPYYEGDDGVRHYKPECFSRNKP